MTFSIRPARLEDIPQLETLIASSIRTLGAADYSSEQIEVALKGAFGVDTQLLKDETYFVVESNSSEKTQNSIIACGGWSFRKTLFGSDQHNARDASTLDPATDAAKIRAFFVAPEASRQGIGKALLAHCENEAIRHGFHKAELMATLPGVKMYSRLGYIGKEQILHQMTDAIAIEFVPMTKQLRVTDTNYEQ